MSSIRAALFGATVCVVVSGTQGRAASPLIINEYNCVSDLNFIEADGAAYEGFDYGAIGAATTSAGVGKAGRIAGAGGNWVEFVVTQDRVDLRGFTFAWDNVDPDAGSVQFANSPVWSNVRAGTIITFIEDGLQTPLFSDGSTGPIMNLDTDIGYNPGANDWWINVDIDDARYLVQNGLKVDNDNWRGQILNASGTVVQDWVGEGVAGWGGTGVNSREVVSMVGTPADSITNANYNDTDYSTFGAPNLVEPAGAATINDLVAQDFSALRSWWTNRLPGDANVDGSVNFADLLTLAQNYGGTVGQTWFTGDFDLNGATEFNDLLTLAQNYGSGLSLLDASLSFESDWALAQSLVPEPTMLTSLGLLLVAKRRR